jgi:ribose transport system permease protein
MLGLERFGTLAILLLLGLYFAVASPNHVFVTWNNLSSIIQVSSVLGVVAAGLTMVLVIGDFDLSVSGNMVLAVLVSARVAVETGTTLTALFAAVLASAAVGLVNAFIVSKLRVDPFIATLAMGLFVLVGLQQRIAPLGAISIGLPSDFADFGNGTVFGIRYVVLAMIGVLIALHVLLAHTPTGRNMYAIGGNIHAARLTGIRVERLRTLAYVLSGVCCGIAGFMNASIFNLGNAQAGGTLLLDSFTACFIGAATIVVGRFHILGTVIGVMALGMMTNGLTLVGWQADSIPVAKGVVLILAVAVTGLLRAKRR